MVELTILKVIHAIVSGKRKEKNMVFRKHTVSVFNNENDQFVDIFINRSEYHGLEWTSGPSSIRMRQSRSNLFERKRVITLRRPGSLIFFVT